MGLQCFFVSDLHGSVHRYESLLSRMREEQPDALFLGGDLLPGFSSLPHSDDAPTGDFLRDYLIPALQRLHSDMEARYPEVFVIMGNDDGRAAESVVLEAEEQGLWRYAHDRRHSWRGWEVYGYAYVPPTPFLLKDWERYDVSRYVPPGSVPPEEGGRSFLVPENQILYTTISDDLRRLAEAMDPTRTIFLFHTPPYQTRLDRAALDGKQIDHVPLDVHVGSIAVSRFIEERQPRITLHGHIHESSRLTGAWSDRLGNTTAFNAAHDGPELALIRFDPARPESARRQLL